MAPTVFRNGAFRFFFFSREEARLHVHVSHTDGEAKFWLEPRVELAINQGLSQTQINQAMEMVKQSETVIRDAWNIHFGS